MQPQTETAQHDDLRGPARRDRAPASALFRSPAADRRVRAGPPDRHGARHGGGGGAARRRAALRHRAVRARALGYGGFTEMQQVFRSRLVASVAPSYKERIAGLRRDGRFRDASNPRAVLARFASEGMVSLESLQDGVREKDLARAIALLGAAHTIYVLGLGGSFPVAAHLTYVLRKLGRRVDAARRARQRARRSGGSRDAAGRADRHQLQDLQSRHGAAVSRAGRARRAGGRPSPTAC